MSLCFEKQAKATMEQTRHIAILSSLGMGHLIPLLALAERLVHLSPPFSITLIIPNTATSPPPKPQLQALQALPDTINYLFLPPVSLDHLPKHTASASLIYHTMALSLSSLRDTLKQLAATTKLVALIVDHYGTDAFQIACEFHITPYLFFPASTLALSYVIHLAELDEKVSGEFRDVPAPFKAPGCIPIHGRDLMDPVQHRGSELYNWFLYHSKRFKLAKGIIANSFWDLEPGPLGALQLQEEPPVYPIGPLVWSGFSTSGSERPECLSWLDSQPSGSVLFVSFGSGGTLSRHQQHELALGLEMSGQRFIWVVRSPDEESSNAAYLSGQRQCEATSSLLPDGFLDRTKGHGVVLGSWGPQAEVLSHGSTGGFLSHCGWNSTLESVVNGVPLIAWPLYGEQKMNGLMLVEEVKVGARARRAERGGGGGGGGLVGREAIAEVIKSVMKGEEGKRLRKRMAELREAAANAVVQDGASTQFMSKLVHQFNTALVTLTPSSLN